MQFHEHVEKNLTARSLLKRGERVLIGVSGGVDSMVLLQVLHQLAVKYNWKLFVAHFNHQLRGRSSDGDERFVAEIAKRLGREIFSGRENVKQLARKSGKSIEMAAREVRHGFLAATAKKLRCKKIALAHHADDQVELFFLRLLRGSGGEGIAGMKWQSPSPADANISLVRPLLDLDRRDIESFAREQRIKFRNDASNARLDLQRNRIRHELLPLLKTKYQPALTRTILRTMQIVGDESVAVGEFAKTWLKGSEKVPFEKLPAAVQRRCLQLQLQSLQCHVDFELVEQLRNNADVPVSAASNAILVRDDKGKVRIVEQSNTAFNSAQSEVCLEDGSGEHIFDGVKIVWQISKGRRELIGKGQNEEIFDADAVGPRVLLRHWRPGDRYVPIGMSASVKLQDCFINLRIPAERRRKVAVAATESGEIFWVEGLRISDAFKLKPQTRRSLCWRWSRA